MDSADKENAPIAATMQAQQAHARRASGILKAGPGTPVHKRGALFELDPNSADTLGDLEDARPAKRARRDVPKGIDRRVSFASQSQVFYLPNAAEEPTEATMEFTSVHGGILSAAPEAAEDAMEASMELTSVHGGILHSGAEESAPAETTMDFTSVHGGVLAAHSPAIATAETTMEFTSVHGGILMSGTEESAPAESTMDFTSVHGGILAAAHSPADAPAETTMEFTNVHGGILPPGDEEHAPAESTMDFTSVHGGVLAAHDSANVPAETTMEFTTVHGGVLSGEPDVPDATMEFTSAHGGILSAAPEPVAAMSSTEPAGSAAHATAQDTSFTPLVTLAEVPAQPVAPAVALSAPITAAQDIAVAGDLTMEFAAIFGLSASASVASAGVAEGNAVSVADFLGMAGISFLDNLSSRRRTTVAGAMQPPADLGVLSERLRVKCAVLPELALMEWGCENLDETTDAIRANTEVLDRELSKANPKVFAALSKAPHTRGPLHQALRQLKTHSRMETKLKRYEWQCKLEAALAEEFEDNALLLREDADRMRALDSRADQALRELGARRDWMAREVRRMERHALAPHDLAAMAARAEEARELEGKMRGMAMSVDTAKGYLSGVAADVERAKAENARLSAAIAEARSRAVEEARQTSPAAVEAAADNCELAEALSVFGVEAASMDHLRFAFLDGRCALTVAFDRTAAVGPNGEVPLASCALQLAPDCDDTLRALFAASGAEQILGACTTSKSVRPVVDAIARRLSRVAAVEGEIRAVAAKHGAVLTVSNGADARECSVALRLVDAKACLEFDAVLALNPCAYPFGHIASSVNVVEGSAPQLAQALAAAVDACRGFGRIASTITRLLSTLS